jgi:hypothetical protein
VRRRKRELIEENDVHGMDEENMVAEEEMYSRGCRCLSDSGCPFRRDGGKGELSAA